METEQVVRRSAARWTDEEDAILKRIVIENPSASMQDIANKATSELDRAVPGILRRLRQLREEDSEMARHLPPPNRRGGGGRPRTRETVRASAGENTGLARSMIRIYLSGEAADEVERQIDSVIQRYGELRAINVLSETLLHLPEIISGEVKRRLR